MLIYFEISNLFSFHQPARLTMEAVPRQRRHKNHEIPGRGRNDPALLRVAAIYGANASGKSNLVRSMELVANLVEHGVALDKAIPCPRFKLDPAAAQAPAEAEVAFKIDGRAYLYRLAWTPQAIHYEALFRHRPDGEPGPRDILFERHGGPATNPAPATPGPALPATAQERDDFGFIARGTRPNQPLLREAVERNFQPLRPFWAWFASTLSVVWTYSKPEALELDIRHHADYQAFLGNLLSVADTRAARVESEKLDLDANPSLQNLKAALEQDLLRDGRRGSLRLENERGGRIFAYVGEQGDVQADVVRIECQGAAGPVRFELDEESEGTRRLIELSTAWWNLLQSGRDKVFVIDEIDRSLHPAVVEMLLKLFLDHDPTPNNSQLIFTTHQTQLLDLDLFRKDEVWFTEVDRDGASKLVSLAEYDVRHDKDVRKDYLLGHYGGVPYIGNYPALGVAEPGAE